MRARAISVVSRRVQSPVCFCNLLHFPKYVRTLQSPLCSSDFQAFPFKVFVILFISTAFATSDSYSIKQFLLDVLINTSRKKAVHIGRALNKSNKEKSYKWGILRNFQTGQIIRVILERDFE